ncbi:MAG: hypothetical protein P8J50_17730 [Acidimicrobiales bacterium]|jgi:hypothetical protein|nr:hypothetical protein [Acidimicrobiales bacterium]
MGPDLGRGAQTPVGGLGLADIYFFPNNPEITTQNATGVGGGVGLAAGASALRCYWWAD